MTLVVDASVALTWCFTEERRVETDAIGEQVSREGSIVPTLFHLELANVLLIAVRRQRISFADMSEKLDEIAALPIVSDDETTARAWTDILPLARSERLTVYDAAYLELAMRLGMPLATLDQDLATAARRRGVEVLP